MWRTHVAALCVAPDDFYSTYANRVRGDAGPISSVWPTSTSVPEKLLSRSSSAATAKRFEPGIRALNLGPVTVVETGRDNQVRPTTDARKYQPHNTEATDNTEARSHRTQTTQLNL